MQTISKWSGVALVVAVAFLAATEARANDADKQEVAAYVLTDAGLAKFTQASQNLKALPKGGPGQCGSDDDDSDATDGSISGLVAKLESVPGAAAAVQSAGLTTREYIVFTMSLLQNGLASWAVKQPGAKLPPGVNRANVEFVNSHGPQLQQLREIDKHGCGDVDEDDSSE